MLDHAPPHLFPSDDTQLLHDRLVCTACALTGSELVIGRWTQAMPRPLHG